MRVFYVIPTNIGCAWPVCLNVWWVESNKEALLRVVSDRSDNQSFEKFECGRAKLNFMIVLDVRLLFRNWSYSGNLHILYYVKLTTKVGDR